MNQTIPAKQIAQVNGIKLFYRIAGSGSPVVLLHGYTQTESYVESYHQSTCKTAYGDCS